MFRAIIRSALEPSTLGAVRGAIREISNVKPKLPPDILPGKPAETPPETLIKKRPDLVAESEAPQNPQPSCKIVYDGSCIPCRTAVKVMHPKDAELINARDGDNPDVQALERKGIKLDDGMAVITPDGTIHTGPDAAKALERQASGGAQRFFYQKVGEYYDALKSFRDNTVPETIAEQRAREKKVDGDIDPSDKPLSRKR